MILGGVSDLLGLLTYDTKMMLAAGRWVRYQVEWTLEPQKKNGGHLGLMWSVTDGGKRKSINSCNKVIGTKR